MGLLAAIIEGALNESVKEGPAKRKAADQAEKEKNKVPDLDSLIEFAHEVYGEDFENEK